MVCGVGNSGGRGLTRMMKNILRYIPLFLQVLFVMLLVNCATSATNPIDAAGIEALTGTESGLYESEDGAFSIPVTIAKLHPFNVEKIDMQIYDTVDLPDLPGLPDISAPLLTKHAETPTTSYVITASADTVGTVDTGVEEVLLINTLTTQRVIATVTAERGFQAIMPAEAGTPILMMSWNSELEVAGPPIAGSLENTVMTWNLSNAPAGFLSTKMILLDRKKIYFATYNAEAETFDVIARHLNGTIQVVATGFASPPRDINVNIRKDVAIVTSSGLVIYVPYNDSTETYGDKRQIYNIGENLNKLTVLLEPPSAKVSLTADAAYVYTDTFMNASDTVPQPFLLTRIDLTTNEVTKSVRSDTFSRAVFSNGIGTTMYVAAEINFGEPNQRFVFFSIDLDEEQPWVNRTFLRNHVVGTDIVSMFLSYEEHLVFVDDNDVWKRFYQYDDGLAPMMFMRQRFDAAEVILPWVVLDPLSEGLDTNMVTCKVDIDNSANDEILYFNISAGVKEQVSSLTNYANNNSCSGSYGISEQGIVVFFQRLERADGTLSPPQLSIIDLNKLDETQLPDANVL